MSKILMNEKHLQESPEDTKFTLLSFIDALKDHNKQLHTLNSFNSECNEYEKNF